jgi:hypothetical protein
MQYAYTPVLYKDYQESSMNSLLLLERPTWSESHETVGRLMVADP